MHAKGRDSLDQQVQASIAKGAVAYYGGVKVEGKGAFYPPTILTNVLPGMVIHIVSCFFVIPLAAPLFNPFSSFIHELLFSRSLRTMTSCLDPWPVLSRPKTKRTPLELRMIRPSDWVDTPPRSIVPDLIFENFLFVR